MGKRRKISQRDARQFKKRVLEFEARDRNRINAWLRDYPGGIHVATFSVSAVVMTIVRTAQILGHPIVVKMDKDADNLRLYALSSSR